MGLMTDMRPSMKRPQQAGQGQDAPHLANVSRPSVTIHIEKLVLHGFAPHDRRRIAAAVEQELTRLMSEKGIPRSLRKNLAVEQVSGGAFHANGQVKPQTTGTLIARTVYESLRHEPSVRTAGAVSPRNVQRP